MLSKAIILATIAMLILIFLKVPVFVSMMSGAMVYFCMEPAATLQIAAQRLTSGMESVSILAAPFFIFTGVMMNRCGVTERVMDFCALVTGRLYGGLAQTNILLSTVMGGMSGSSIADAAMESKILVPEMEKQGLPKPFSAVVTAFSSIITPLIPPGIGMILYGTLAKVSVGSLFMAGLWIGIFCCISMMVMTSVISHKKQYMPLRTERMRWKQFWPVFKRAFFPLMLIVIIIGGIRIGVFTPSEAGAVAVIYTIILGLCYKELTRENFIGAFVECAITTGGIMLIIGAASIYAWALTKDQVPQALSAMMLSIISNKYVFLLIVNIFLLIVGMFMEGCAATVILVPILAPLAAAYGIDPIHMGMVFTLNLSIGVISPPVGAVLYVTCGVTNCKIKDFMKASVPYFLYLLGVLLFFSYIPLFIHIPFLSIA